MIRIIVTRRLNDKMVLVMAVNSSTIILPSLRGFVSFKKVYIKSYTYPIKHHYQGYLRKKLLKQFNSPNLLDLKVVEEKISKTSKNLVTITRASYVHLPSTGVFFSQTVVCRPVFIFFSFLC